MPWMRFLSLLRLTHHRPVRRTRARLTSKAKRVHGRVRLTSSASPIGGARSQTRTHRRL